jgi:hypothetical protein
MQYFRIAFRRTKARVRILSTLSATRVGGGSHHPRCGPSTTSGATTFDLSQTKDLVIVHAFKPGCGRVRTILVRPEQGIPRRHPSTSLTKRMQGHQ